MLSKRIFPFTFFCMVLSITLVLFYYFGLKQNFHIDELYTYGLANSYFQPFPFEKNQWVSGEYYQHYLSPTVDTRFQYRSVYDNQVQDVHPPFYYAIIHTVSSFIPGVFSKWTGLSINLVIHLLIFGLVFLLLKKLTHHRWLALVGASFWTLSAGALSSASFIRMYHLVTLLQVALLYLSLTILSDEIIKKRALLGVALVSFVGGMTHYYFYLYAFVLVLLVCLVLLLQRKWLGVLFYGGSSLVGVIAALISFPAVFTHLTASNRGLEVMANLQQTALPRQNPYLIFIKEGLLLNIRLRYSALLCVVLGLGLVIYLWKSKKMTPFWQLICCAIPAGAYIFVVQQISHYQTPRYIYSIYPMIVISLVILGYFGLRGLFRHPRLPVAIVSVLAVVGIVVSLVTTSPDYLYESHQSIPELVDKPEEQSIFVLSDQYWKVAQVVHEIQAFDAIYPSIITNSLTNLPDTVEADHFYVLMLPNEKQDYDNVMKNIAAKYNRVIAKKTMISEDEILYYLVGEVEVE